MRIFSSHGARSLLLAGWLQRRPTSAMAGTCILVLCIGFTAAYPRTAWASTGSEAAAFLDIPVGARPAALGGSYSALSTDAIAPVWNPAGLGWAKDGEFAGTHLSWLDRFSYEYAGLAWPLRPGRGIGLAVQYFRPEPFEGRDADGVVTGEVTGYYSAVTASYGQALGTRWAAGLSARRLQARLSEVSASAWGFDAGLFYRVSPRWNLAAVIANAGTSMRFLQQKDPLPLAGRLAAAARFANGWTAAAGITGRRTGRLSGQGGLEWRPGLAALRMGYRSDTLAGRSVLAGFSAGAGIRIWGNDLDYAWLPLDTLGSSHYVSLALRLARPEKERRNLVIVPSQPSPERGVPQENDNEWMDPLLLEVLTAERTQALAQ